MFLFWLFITIGLGLVEKAKGDIDALRYKNSDNGFKTLDNNPLAHDEEWYRKHPDVLDLKRYKVYLANQAKRTMRR